MPGTTTRPRGVPAAFRRFLLTIFMLRALGSAGELLLVEHHEGPWRYAPLLLVQLRREIGKYVDSTEVARLERYVELR